MSRGDALDVPLRLDPSRGDQARQLHASLRGAILEGRLSAGLRLPSTRALSDQVGVRRNVVVTAYEHLQADGLIEGRAGAGTYVAARLPTPPATTASAPSPPSLPSRSAFALGLTHTDPILIRRLAAAAKGRILRASAAALGYGDPRGSEDLRRLVASHLAASRGVRCDPGRVVVVSGTQQGLRLCAEALLRPGDGVWFEDPGYPAARSTLEAAGLRPIPVPVDAEGLDVAAGCRIHPASRAAYVTPSNQFPTGATMSMDRRLALVDWARATGAWILEDDYDNEFRYEGPPLTALAGIADDRVIYLGTFSKVLFAGLRLAYLVLPPAAVDRVVASRATHDRFPPTLTEGVVADLMSDGTLAAHTRRMRARYRGARDALHAALSAAAEGSLRIDVPRQGLHLVAYLPAGLASDAAARIREASGVEARLLSEMRSASSPEDGFVLGFAGHDVGRLTEGARHRRPTSRDWPGHPSLPVGSVQHQCEAQEAARQGSDFRRSPPCGCSGRSAKSRRRSKPGITYSDWHASKRAQRTVAAPTHDQLGSARLGNAPKKDRLGIQREAICAGPPRAPVRHEGQGTPRRSP